MQQEPVPRKRQGDSVFRYCIDTSPGRLFCQSRCGFSLSMTRRDWLQASASAAVAGALLPAGLRGQSDEPGPNPLAGVWLEPFVDPLPLLPRLLSERAASEQRHRVTVSQVSQRLHRDLPPTVVWGYNGSMPGPTILARRNEPITIDWVNQLPPRHHLTIDHTLCGAGADLPEVRTVTHLHGGHVDAKNDGYPEDWIPPAHTQRTIYPNRQPGATLWYHDHAMGITRLNAMMGLAGFYILQDTEEEALGLPSGAYDVPLVLQDRSLDPNGQLIYPVSADPKMPSIPEFFGTHLLVNGRVTPYFEVEPRLYRFRLLNASNARVLQLSLSPGQEFFQIGSDGGLLERTVVRRDLLIAPGERVDMLIDFRRRDGKRITVLNDATAPYPSGGSPVPRLVMQFRVRHSTGSTGTLSAIPEQLTRLPAAASQENAKARRLLLEEIMASPGQPHRVLLNGALFMDAPTEDPVSGTTEIWELVNTTKDAHPIHLHAVHFRILDRQPFDVRRQLERKETVLRNKPIVPEEGERGWKDTVICPPSQVTRLLVPFAAEPGRYVWHCHTLEHEDNEMMRPLVIRAPRATA